MSVKPDFENFVRSLYRGLLNREPEAIGLADWVDRLTRGELTPHQVALSFLSSREFRMTTGIFRLSRESLAIAGRDAAEITKKFPLSYNGGGAEASKSYLRRIESGFCEKYYSGEIVLDIGFRGADNPDNETIVPHAVGVDTDYPNYDGINLPFDDRSVDCVSSSHCLEHIINPTTMIREWYRVLKIGGFICCFVPHRDLYERKRFPPSNFNDDHKTFFTSASLLALFETSLDVNSFRVRHLVENDLGYDYMVAPTRHAAGCYEIELVLEKIERPNWTLA